MIVLAMVTEDRAATKARFLEMVYSDAIASLYDGGDEIPAITLTSLVELCLHEETLKRARYDASPVISA